MILTNFVTVAQGNQGFEGVHQDHEEREEIPPSGRKDHNQEEQEEQHHQAEAPYATLPIHSLSRRQGQGGENHAEYPSKPQERPP